MEPLEAISPVDGRYREKTEDLALYLSEYALMRYRLVVMTEYLIELSLHEHVPLRAFREEELRILRGLQQPTLADVGVIKKIETEGWREFARTNHDVKACEFYLRSRLATTSLADVLEWIHFGATSEDVNNIAYALMLQGARDHVLVPVFRRIHANLRRSAHLHATLALLARSHGQAASPTTLGKEWNVFAGRLNNQLSLLRDHRMRVKCNSATGNYNALYAALPAVDWIEFSVRFIDRLAALYSPLAANLITTQIEPHDTHAEFFDVVRRINTILLDLSQDVWRYISDDWLGQISEEGESGSSIMPHKVNPIDWENSEGNLKGANALCEMFSRELPRSRLQRDLSDSTVERMFGTALGHCLVAYRAIERGLGKITPNEAKIRAALHDHPEVIAEAYQTILRREGVENPYLLLKEFTRGRQITIKELHAFVEGLDVAEDVKAEMLAITPKNYIGRAPTLARM